MTAPVSAAVLLIGDELLSGRTQDVNLQAIAKFLGPLGVQIAEARVVADIPEEIVAAVNVLRARYAYLVTTGGIGPTHDDKTVDAVAAAFGVPVIVHPEARAILEAHYKGAPLNEARLRMARSPDGASLIPNPVSKAPGFQIGNVFILAGVPSIMRGMLEGMRDRIEGGAVMLSATLLLAGAREGDIAEELTRLQDLFPDASMGSYPSFGPQGSTVRLVVRAMDGARFEAARTALATSFSQGVWVEE